MRLQRYEKNTIWQNGKRIILRFEELGGVICWFNTAMRCPHFVGQG